MKRFFVFFGIGFFLLAGLAEISLGAGDSEEKLRRQIEDIKDQISEAQLEIDNFQEKVDRIAEKTALAERIQKSLTDQMGYVSEAQELSGKLEREIKDRKLLLDAYRRQFAAGSDLAPNTELGDLTMNDGKVYKGAVFKRISGNLIQIAHSGGFASVEKSQLPPSLMGKFTTPPKSGLEINLGAIFSAKPDILKTDDQRYEDKIAERDKERKEMEVESQMRSEQVRAESEKKKAANLVLRQKIAALEASANELNRAINAQQNFKRSIVREREDNKFYGRTVTSAADFKKTVAAYDAKIGSLEAQKAKIDAEISALYAKIQY